MCDTVCRFVGLLLAVRLLPQGSDDAIREVVNALGWRFITRLLLPLSPSSPPAAKHSSVADPTSQQSQVGVYKRH
jgi:hypothetical protein